MESHLREAARFHSQDMGQRNYFAHDAKTPGAPNGVTLIKRIENAGYANYQSVAENIAAGSANAAGAMNQWMTSTSGHCDAIMDPGLEEIGVGYALVNSSQYTQLDPGLCHAVLTRIIPKKSATQIAGDSFQLNGTI